jgi:hypothetical protein
MRSGLAKMEIVLQSAPLWTNDQRCCNKESAMSSPYSPPQYIPPQPTVVTDIHIPFWRLVGIFVKWALAAIPATIILVIIFMVVGFVIAAVLAALGVNIRPPMGATIP